MAILDGKKTQKNLLKKGFRLSDNDHHFFEFWHQGIFVSKTKTSHNGQDITDGLIGAMSKQCHVKKDFFIQFAKCTKSQKDYEDELQKNGVIK